MDVELGSWRGRRRRRKTGDVHSSGVTSDGGGSTSCNDGCCFVCSSWSSDGHVLPRLGTILAVSLLLFLLLLDGAVVRVSALNSTFSSSSSIRTTTRKVSALRLQRIKNRLEKINKPAVRTIESPDGDIIDCVHLQQQAALDHPLLKDHRIQIAPMVRPTFDTGRAWRPTNYSSDDPTSAWQTWHHVGHCPEGTIPVRRTTVGDVLRAKSLFHFGKKQRRGGQRLGPLATTATSGSKVAAPDVVSGNGHEHAIAYTKASQEVYGAKATINVWEPSIGAENEFSLSQIWILSGSFDGSDLNSIEAGWQVSPELYGDNKPRLFTYWTSDAYQATGCYNLLCSGFVQTNSKIAIGAAISPVSSFNTNQFDITILIWKDPRLGNWWMGFGDNMLVGYWPSELFTHLADHATMVEWGGEIVNMRANGMHTATQMGSGHFAEDGFGQASYFRNLEVVDADNSLSSIDVDSIATLAENTNCYDIRSSSNNDWGTYFYYGGPGYNPKCP